MKIEGIWFTLSLQFIDQLAGNQNEGLWIFLVTAERLTCAFVCSPVVSVGLKLAWDTMIGCAEVSLCTVFEHPRKCSLTGMPEPERGF
jgi:hypothetical protein